MSLLFIHGGGPRKEPPVVRDVHASGRTQRHRERMARRVQEVCTDATSTAEVIDGLREPFNAALGLSGMLLSATDPDTTALGTATVVEHLPAEIATPWMHNEVLVGDFNKFANLHRTRQGPVTLHRASQGHPHMSPRYRELHQPHGLGAELRVVFSRDSACLGVANLVRGADDVDFSDDELQWMQALRPTIAAGLRRTAIMADTTGDADDGIGVISLDRDGGLVSMTGEAERLMADLWLCPFGEEDTYRLPGEAYMIATLARARTNRNLKTPQPVTRLRGQSGRWLTMRGDCTLTTDGEMTGIVLIIGPSRPAEILPMVVAAYGLTRREQEVLTEISKGQSTAEIAGRLFISEHTVRDHIKSILTKTGTSSRGEVMSLLFQHGG